MSNGIVSISFQIPKYCINKYYEKECLFFVQQIDTKGTHYGSCGYSCALVDHWFDLRNELVAEEKPS